MRCCETSRPAKRDGSWGVRFARVAQSADIAMRNSALEAVLVTRLARAYNREAPHSGKILTGGVDASALAPPKRFFGGARCVEEGGSLTVIATALIDTGSRMDEVIFEEFKGTGNSELHLDRRLVDRRIWPAIDITRSGSRKEELLLDPQECRLVMALRRVLAEMQPTDAMELLINRVRKTASNAEFLMAMGTD